MIHCQAFAGQTAFVPHADCDGQLHVLERHADRELDADGRCVDRTIYVMLCASCGHIVSLARAHDIRAELIPLAFKLLNSYPGPRGVPRQTWETPTRVAIQFQDGFVTGTAI